MTEPPPEPTTARLGGGGNARLVAIAVAGALGLVAWIGFSGRPPPPPPPPAVADVATDSPRPSDALTPTPETAPSASPRATAAATPEPERYLIIGVVGQSSFRTELVEVAPGRLSGQYRLPSPPAGNVLAFEITPPPTAERAPGDTLGTWMVSLDMLASNHRAGIAGHMATVPARPTQLNAPRPIRLGFDLGISVRLAFDHVAAIDFEALLDDAPRHELRGDDGIVGCRAFGTCSLSPAAAGGAPVAPQFGMRP